MERVLTYDMRAPAFGAPAAELWAAAVDQAAWADGLGFDVIGLGEHHASEDGYNPSPIVLATAMAARTRRIRLRPSVVLAPFYQPIKLAEDAAVLQILSNGRLELGIGGGYRREEFEMFGRDLSERWRSVGDLCRLLRLAWSGEPFEWQGRRCHVTPKPDTPPAILLGGATANSARRAARIADGWLPPLDPRLWKPYREACLELGKPDPGAYPRQGPIFLWISDDPDRAWVRLMPHVLHQIRMYARWTAEAWGKVAGPYAGEADEAAARNNPAYRVVSPEQALELADALGPDGVLYLSPLLAGIDPRESDRMLALYERSVDPYLPGRATDKTGDRGTGRGTDSDEE